MSRASFRCCLFLLLRSAALSTHGAVFLDAELPGRLQGTKDEVFAGRGEFEMGGSVTAPTAMNGDEDFGRLGDKHRLLFRREHQVAVPLGLRSQRGKDAAPDAEVG